MGRVVWVNGTFGAGKTTVAEMLVARLDEAFLLDPEIIGVMLRDHLVPTTTLPDDFQDISLWRAVTRDAVIDAASRYDGTIVVPMTIARIDYFDEIVGAIRERVQLDHFTLVVSKQTVLDRDATRPDDTGGWPALMVDRVLPALEDPRFAVHIDAETRTAGEVADDIIRRLA